MQFRLVYEDVQDGAAVIKGSTENIPTNDDKVLCNREDLENKGLVYETRDENDGLVIMTSKDHLPGGDDDCQVYPMIKETPKPDPKPGDGGEGGNGGTEVGGETGGENGGEQTGGETGETEVPKVEE